MGNKDFATGIKSMCFRLNHMLIANLYSITSAFYIIYIQMIKETLSYINYTEQQK